MENRGVVYLGNLLHYFIREADGSWRCVRHAELEGPTGRIQVTAGARFAPGMIYMGIDLAHWLDEQERHRRR